ncbi:MAG: rhomboid family intramembrane serine protease [Syntrophales bacterium]|nr:rhomboid family intramembrane serine protease [Syntrophales bacterium]
MERNSLLCPNCRRLISSDEPVCPYCGLEKPGARWRSSFLARLSRGAFDPVKSLIYTNVLFYILSLLLNPSSMGLSSNPLQMMSPSEGSLFLLGATGTLPILQFGRWWTLVTASFLHGGILHIFFNMMALHQLGPFILAEYGFSRFIVIYILTGVAGFFLSTIAGIPFTIGASASICGLIGAILYFGKSRGGFYGEAIFRQAMGWVVGLVLFGLIVPGINNWAHGGGIISGIAIAFILGYEERRRETGFHRTAGAVCLLVTICLLVLDVLQALYNLLFHAAYFR